MAVNDIYRIIMKGSYLGQVCQNAWFYKQTLDSAGDAPEALRAIFSTAVLFTMVDIQTTDYVWFRQEVQNIGDAGEFTELNLVQAGTIVATKQAPAFTCAMFSSNRNGFGSRRGFKRIAGLDNDKIDGNGYTGLSTELNDTSDAFGQSLTDGSDSFIPVIARRPIVIGQNPLFFEAHTWAFQRVTTQNSRKVGTLIIPA